MVHRPLSGAVSDGNLAVRLREGTHAAHTRVERTPFVRCFLKGALPRASYVELLARLYPVYAALEAALDENRAHPAVAPIHLPALVRAPALVEDLTYFGSEPSAGAALVSPACAGYVARIREVGRTAPELLVAHSYTRYLGDLSGGQMLGKLVARGLELPADGRGTAFYRFAGIDDVAAFKTLYRARLDALPLPAETVSRVVSEADRAFALNEQLFVELEPALRERLGPGRFAALVAPASSRP